MARGFFEEPPHPSSKNQPPSSSKNPPIFEEPPIFDLRLRRTKNPPSISGAEDLVEDRHRHRGEITLPETKSSITIYLPGSGQNKQKLCFRIQNRLQYAMRPEANNTNMNHEPGYNIIKCGLRARRQTIQHKICVRMQNLL